MAQVLAVADFEVEFVDYTRGTVIDFADTGVINYLRMRRVISTSAADVAAAIAGGATQRTHTAGSPPGSGAVPGGSGSVAVQDEGTQVAAASAINFRGAGVTASAGAGGAVNVDIPGAGAASVVELTASRALTTADAGKVLAYSGSTDIYLSTVAGLVTFTVVQNGSGAVYVLGARSQKNTSAEQRTVSYYESGPSTGVYYSEHDQSLNVVNAGLFTYLGSGVVERREMPRNDRIVQRAQRLWAPQTVSGDSVVSIAAYSGVLTGNGDGAVEITHTASGYSRINWPSVGIAWPTDGFMHLLVNFDDFELAGFNTSFTVQLTDTAGGSIRYSFGNGPNKPGWTTLPLWNPANANQNRAFSSNVIVTNSTGFNFGLNIASMWIECLNATVGFKWRFYGLYRPAKQRPLIMMTFDVANNNVFDNFCPAWRARGLNAGLGVGGGTVGWSQDRFTRMSEQYRLGFDCYNQTLSRASLSGATTEDQFAAELITAQNMLSLRGFHRGATLYSSVGNSVPSARVRRKIMPLCGVRHAKSGLGLGRVNLLGVMGVDDPTALRTVGWPGMTAGIADVDAAIEVGANSVIWFAHEAQPRNGDQTDGASPNSGGGIWAEDVPLLADALRQRQDAGLIEVVGPSRYAAIMAGDA